MSTKTSGTAPIATVDDDAVELIPAQAGQTHRHLKIVNQGAEPGFYKIGAGGESNRIPADFFFTDDEILIAEDEAVFIQRVAGGANMTDVFGSIW